MKLSSLMDSKHVRAKNSNGTSVGTFSKFNLLRGRCTLLLSLPLLTSLCAPAGTGYDEKRSIELEYSFALLGTSCKNGKRYRDDNP